MKIFDSPLKPNNYSRQLLSMDVSSPNLLDPERITHQYQQLQYCNYNTYVTLMEQATGQTYNPDPAMGVNASLFPRLFPASSSGHMQRIEGIPPGRPANSISKTREETYGQYKMRTDPNYTATSRDYDPRNGRNHNERKIDSNTAKNSAPVAQDDWDDDGPSVPKKTKTVEPNDDGWNDFLPNDSCSKPSITKSETKPLDEWGDDEKVPVSSTPKQKSDDNGWSDDDGKTSSFGSVFGGSNNRDSSFGSRGSTGGYQGSRDKSRGGRDDGDWNCTQFKANNF